MTTKGFGSFASTCLSRVEAASDVRSSRLLRRGWMGRGNK